MKISSQFGWFFALITFALIASCGNETDSGLQDALGKGHITKDINEADAYTAPKGSLIINSGAVATASTSSTLKLSANDAVGVTAYYASENTSTPTANSSGWSSISSANRFSDNITFTLSSDEGSKTVYAWFKDAAGNVSSVVSDSIILDMTAPANTSVSINSGASTTSSQNVTLTLSATDDVGVTGYYASESNSAPDSNTSGWTSVTSATNYSANVSFTLSSADESKMVYIWYKDTAGNVSSNTSYSITAKLESIIIDGLEWQLATAPSKENWYDASTYCSDLYLGLHKNWRLPTIDELYSLVDKSVSAPKIVAELRDTTFFSSISFYWSSTPYLRYTTNNWSYYSWAVSFDDGRDVILNTISYNYFRCVRDK